MTRMKNPVIIDHPLIKRDLSILRDRTTNNHLFRSTLRRISSVMAFQVTSDLRLKSFLVQTPLERTKGFRLAGDIVIVPVLRAGLGLVEGFLDYLPEARVGHVGLYRNEETLEPVDYYSRFPSSLGRSLVLLLDPMLATGGSGSAAITFLKRKGAREIRFVTLLAAPEGIRRIRKNHPDVRIYSTVVDRKLNAKGYILPGLGDAGDRIFGTE
jgi:uracil phosphoribosyltransferase